MQNKFKILWVILALLAMDSSFAAHHHHERTLQLRTINAGTIRVGIDPGMTVGQMMARIRHYDKNLVLIEARGGPQTISHDAVLTPALVQRIQNARQIYFDDESWRRDADYGMPPK